MLLFADTDICNVIHLSVLFILFVLLYLNKCSCSYGPLAIEKKKKLPYYCTVVGSNPLKSVNPLWICYRKISNIWWLLVSLSFKTIVETFGLAYFVNAVLFIILSQLSSCTKSYWNTTDALINVDSLANILPKSLRLPVLHNPSC